MDMTPSLGETSAQSAEALPLSLLGGAFDVVLKLPAQPARLIDRGRTFRQDLLCARAQATLLVRALWSNMLTAGTVLADVSKSTPGHAAGSVGSG